MVGQSEQHLAAAGEGNGEHFRLAPAIGLRAIGAGPSCPVCALVRALCPRAGSTAVARLQDGFAERRLIEQVAQQSSSAIAFVGLLLISGVAGLIVIGANLVVGALACAAPLGISILVSVDAAA